MKCPKCGGEVGEKDSFCEKCGTALEREKVISYKKSLAVASVVGILLLGYWMIISITSDSPQPLKSTSSSTATVIQTQKVIPTTTIVSQVTSSGKQISVRLGTEMGFTPKTSTIKPGDEVIWTNEGTYAVTLVSSEGLFEDKSLNNAKRISYIFKKLGTFSFYIKDEKSLTGTIIVEP